MELTAYHACRNAEFNIRYWRTDTVAGTSLAAASVRPLEFRKGVR
jgi:hypothetical protein